MDGQKQDKPALKGFYGKIRIPVKVLDIAIVLLTVAMLAVLFVGLQNRGYSVTFDSRGGSDVATQIRLYGEYLEEPEPPTREGYTFTGWYKDEACQEKWQIQTDTVQSGMTLFAGWQKNE